VLQSPFVFIFAGARTERLTTLNFPLRLCVFA
jgi:hypothetical protein